MLELRIARDLNNGDYILKNDVFFNAYIVRGLIKVNSGVKNIMQNIDGAKYIGNLRYISKYGNYAVSVTELSTGCKTAINVYSFTNKMFYIGECGDNALNQIFHLADGKLCIDTFFIPPKFKNVVLVHNEYTGASIKITNNDELEDILFNTYYMG